MTIESVTQKNNAGFDGEAGVIVVLYRVSIQDQGFCGAPSTRRHRPSGLAC
jgi:hypothetical protein